MRILLVPAILIGAALAAGAGAHAQVVEEYVLASGHPRFGELVRIRAGLAVWQRCWEDYPRYPNSTIEFRDLSRLSAPAIEVAASPCWSGDLVLGPTHLFWSDWNRNELTARPIARLRDGRAGTNIRVGPAMAIDTANSRYLFVREFEYVGRTRYRGKILAKSIAWLADPSPDALHEVASFEMNPFASPHSAASEEFFVWIDMNPDLGEETWRIYAKRIDELFVPGAERLVIDSNFVSLTAKIDIAGSLLVFQGSLDPAAQQKGQIYLLDLEGAGDPIPVALSHDPDWVVLDRPGISQDYIVWTDTRGAGAQGLVRKAFGRRLEGGVPVGDAFPLSDGPSSGSWMAFDGNIAVWNGAVRYGEGQFTYLAMVATELELPGARDLGDVDGDGEVRLEDAMVILQYLFHQGWRPRLRLADADGNRRLEVTDAILIIQHCFGNRPLYP